MDSFPVNSQLLHISASEDATATQLIGTYQISGGCANGATGTLRGVKYQPLTGAYYGVIGNSPAAPTATLNLSQAGLGDGRGYSDLTGTADFTNIPCFNNAEMTAPGSYVVGSFVELTLTASDGETVLMEGTFNQQATTITITGVEITGGGCSGSLGAATFAGG